MGAGRAYDGVMFRTKLTFEQEAVVLDDEHVPFASIDDATVEEGVLILTIASGTRRIKLKSGDAMTVLEGVLDGIERTHPKVEPPYRTPGVRDSDVEPAVHARSVLRRKRATGSTDLMIGRTFTAG
jgi:hypothetical protein